MNLHKWRHYLRALERSERRQAGTVVRRSNRQFSVCYTSHILTSLQSPRCVHIISVRRKNPRKSLFSDMSEPMGFQPLLWKICFIKFCRVKMLVWSGNILHLKHNGTLLIDRVEFMRIMSINPLRIEAVPKWVSGVDNHPELFYFRLRSSCSVMRYAPRQIIEQSSIKPINSVKGQRWLSLKMKLPWKTKWIFSTWANVTLLYLITRLTVFLVICHSFLLIRSLLTRV